MSASRFSSEHRPGGVRVVPERDEIIAVCLEGEFDVANVSDLREQVDSAVAAGDDLILDLSEATFIDSSVIRVFFDTADALIGTDQMMVLQLGTAPIVERALEIVCIESVVPRAHDREEAVRIISDKRES